MISINTTNSTPKYKQIVQSIENAIAEGELKKGDLIPSLNFIKTEHQVSRDTVLTAFKALKHRGIIESVVGKGYYISSENVVITRKIMLLFDELNSFKEDLYNAFMQQFDEHAKIDIYFHHFNKTVFDKIISDNAGDYNYYVIMPANLKELGKAIQKLPVDRVYVLDQIHKDLADYPAIFQNFHRDIQTNLNKLLPQIEKYENLILIADDREPEGMKRGFVDFCLENDFQNDIFKSIKDESLKKNSLYIIPNDKDLLRVIKKIKSENLILGQDIGIISYNDTILKEILEGGITTISTDFNYMGERLAQMIINDENIKIENPIHLILRNSI